MKNASRLIAFIDRRFKAIGDGENYKSVYSAVLTAKTEIFSDRLDAPTNACESAKTETTITVAWDAVANAGGYKLAWRNAEDSADSYVELAATEMSYQLTGLANAATYVWSVQALGDGVAYAASEYTSERSARPRQRLETPVLTVSATTDTTIAVTWESIANVDRYVFSYKLASETTWKNVSVGTNLEYTVADLEPGTEYAFRLKAIGDGVNYKSVYSAVLSAKTEIFSDRLDAPTNACESAKTETTITVAWDAVANAGGYKLAWRNAEDSADSYVELAATETSYQLTGLANAATYVWSVQALGDGVAYAASEYTSERSARPRQRLETPVLTVSATTDTTIAVTWESIANVDRYVFSYKLAGETTWKNVKVGTNLDYTITGLEPGAVYDMRLKAIGDGMDYKSVYSAVAQAQTASASSAAFDSNAELFGEFFDELDEEDLDLLAANFKA